MTNKPNILFVFSDQQHWQAVGFEDPSFDTPSLNRLAREGTVFTYAFCTTPQCSPSRSSMLTGLYPSKTGVIGNIGMAGGDPLRMPTIGTVLQDAGYYTAYFGKWHLGKDPAGTGGWDEDFGVIGPETNDDLEVTRRALSFLEQADTREQPFALFLSYRNPHDIYHFNKETDPAPKGKMVLPDSWHSKDLSTCPGVQEQFMREDQGKVIDNAEPCAWERYREIYREKVKLYDDELGKVLAGLDESGLFKNTLIIATSDHGDMDTQHGLIYKGPFMYEHMMRVPLIIRLPETETDTKPQNAVVFPCVNVDLAPTLADFAGTALAETDGLSLKPLLTGEGEIPQRDFVIGQYYSKQQWVNPIRMIRTGEYKYNLYQVHGEELYDLVEDPCEIKNIASEKKYADMKTGIAAALEGWITDNDDPFHTLNPTDREGEVL